MSSDKCEKCGKQYEDATHKLCKPCTNSLKNHNITTTFGNEKIDNIIQEIQLIIGDEFKWISYDQFNDIKKIGKGGFATVYSAKWSGQKGIKETIALKFLHNTQNNIEDFLNEVKAHSIKSSKHILKTFGISQHPETKDYIIVLEYARGGNFNDWIIKNYNNFDWSHKLKILVNILYGLKEIHQKNIVHRDFHTGNILVKNDRYPCISDMGLSGVVGNIDETKVFGVMPYVAPEVLKGKPYTKPADMYSLGMIMYFLATGRQPFGNCAHDRYLASSIMKGIRPKINVLEAPKCYIDLMKRCWDSNPDNRPNANETFISVGIFFCSYVYAKKASLFKPMMSRLCGISIEKEQQHEEIEKQFQVAEEYRKVHPLSNESQPITHSKASYISQLLNSHTKDPPKYDDDFDNANFHTYNQDEFIISDDDEIDTFEDDEQQEA